MSLHIAGLDTKSRPFHFFMTCMKTIAPTVSQILTVLKLMRLAQHYAILSRWIQMV